MIENGIAVSINGLWVDKVLHNNKAIDYCFIKQSLFNNIVNKKVQINIGLVENYHPDLRKVLADRLENKIQKESGILTFGKKLVKCIDSKLLKLELEKRIGYMPSLLKNYERAAYMNSLEIRLNINLGVIK